MPETSKWGKDRIWIELGRNPQLLAGIAVNHAVDSRTDRRLYESIGAALALAATRELRDAVWGETHTEVADKYPVRGWDLPFLE